MVRLAKVAALGLLLVGLIGCGNEAAKVPPVETAVGRSDSADISSGCWTAADRDGNTGEDTVPEGQQWSEPPKMVIDGTKKYSAAMTTSKGVFTIELLQGDAPLAANNFYCLAEAGFYDGTPFHRIVAGFVIQGGDPTGTGRGGPGYKFKDEPIVRDYVKGTVAMANSGANTNGSQFFVVVDDLRGKLGKNYTIFGNVTSGMDVVDAIAATPTKAGASGEKSTPLEPVILESVVITEA